MKKFQKVHSLGNNMKKIYWDDVWGRLKCYVGLHTYNNGVVWGDDNPWCIHCDKDKPVTKKEN